MARFPVHTIDTAPAASCETLEAARKRFGMLPNLLGIMAESPTALKAYTAVADLFGGSSFTPVEQQIVLLSVSFENSCEYCMAAHSALALHSGAGREFVAALREGTALPDPRLNALARFTRCVVRQRGWLPESEVTSFLAAGYTPAQVFEVLVGVAQKTLSNYVNHLASTPLDEAFRSQAWARSERRGFDAA